MVNCNFGTTTFEQVLSNLIGVFVSPQKTFRRTKQNPNWLVPFVIVIVCSAITTYFLSPVIWESTFKEEYHQRYESAGMSEEVIAERLAVDARLSPYMMTIGAVAWNCFAILIVSGTILLVGNVILPGQAKFKQMLSVTSHSFVVFAYGTFLLLPLTMYTGILDLTSIAGILLDNVDGKNFIHVILTKVELFTIWMVILLGIGAAELYGWHMRKGIGILLLLWGAQTIVVSGLTLWFT